MQSTNTVQPGYVYVKAHKNSRGLHKIGLTRRPEQREQQLGGDDCRVVARVLVNDPEALEDLLHQQFDEVRLPQSEWFNLSDEQLREALEELVKAHDECLQHVVLPDLSEPEPEPEPKEREWLGFDLKKAASLANGRPYEYEIGRGFFTK